MEKEISRDYNQSFGTSQETPSSEDGLHSIVSLKRNYNESCTLVRVKRKLGGMYGEMEDCKRES